jgi:hypothetical protein
MCKLAVTAAELTMILTDHQKWIAGKGGARAELIDRDLRGCDLSGSNLSGCNLSGCNLRGSNLSGCDLRGCNLSGSNLSGSIAGSICRMDFGGWSICIRADKTSIGCQTQDNEWWLEQTSESEAIIAMHPGAAAWWAIYGPAIKAAIKVVMGASR